MSTTTTDISGFTPEQKALFGAAAKLAPAGSVQTSDAPVLGPAAPGASSTGSGAAATKVPRYPSTVTPGGTPTPNAVDAAETAYQTSTTPETPEAVSARVGAMYAQELAGIKAHFADVMAGEKVTSANSTGRTRASAAAGGVLGMDFGNQELDATDKVNKQNEQNVSDQESAAEGAVYSKENTDVENELQSQKTTNQTALQQKISYLKDQATAAQSQVATIAGTTALADLPQDTYDSLYQKAGFDTPEEFNAYYEAAHNAALMGVKLVGDATTGYYTPQIDPSTGQISYNNVIKAKKDPIAISGSQYGNYVYNQDSGEITTVSPGQQYQIKSAGGQLWRIENSSGKATPLTPKYTGVTKVGWDHATVDQQLAVQRWIEDQSQQEGKDPSTYIKQVQGDQTAFLTALNASLDAGYYTPITVQQTGTDTSADDAATQAQNAADDVSNGQ